MELSDNVQDAHELELLFSMPFQWTKQELAYTDTPKRHYKYWSIRWFDLIPGYNQTLFGSFICQPFFEDPPTEQQTRDYNKQSHTYRRGWNLQESPYFEDSLECFRLGVGLYDYDVTLRDMARCMIPAIGILARQHPAVVNSNNTILKRTMLRLERQVQTWNHKDSDPNTWETSESLHRRAGMLTHPNVVAALQRENRWDNASSSQDDDEFPEGAQVCQYRDEAGYQYRMYKLANGKSFTVPTSAKKGVEGSVRTKMSSIAAVAALCGMSPQEAEEHIRNVAVYNNKKGKPT